MILSTYPPWSGEYNIILVIVILVFKVILWNEGKNMMSDIMLGSMIFLMFGSIAVILDLGLAPLLRKVMQGIWNNLQPWTKFSIMLSHLPSLENIPITPNNLVFEGNGKHQLEFFGRLVSIPSFWKMPLLLFSTFL